MWATIAGPSALAKRAMNGSRLRRYEACTTLGVRSTPHTIGCCATTSSAIQFAAWNRASTRSPSSASSRLPPWAWVGGRASATSSMTSR